MKQIVKSIVISIIMLFAFVACNIISKKSDNSMQEQDEIHTDENLSPCPLFNDTTIHFVNPYFKVDTTDLVERSIYETGTLPTHRIVDMGGRVGKAEIQISDRMFPEFCCNGDTFIINCMGEKKGIGKTILSMKAADLDGDGTKELLVHNGEFSLLFIYKVDYYHKPNFRGSISENSEFFITNDRTIVARTGSQGQCTRAHFTNGCLKVNREEDYAISTLMFHSKDYGNLRYDFDECSDDKLAPLLDTKKYSISNKGMTVLHEDLNDDGTMEQIVYFHSTVGITSRDYLTIIYNNTEVDLLGSILGIKEVVGVIENTDLDDVRVIKPIQLSSLDCDNDGIPELIVSIGSFQRNSSIIFKMDKNGCVDLVKHIKLNRKPTEEDMTLTCAR